MSGTITRDTTWSKAQSPYALTGNGSVAAGRRTWTYLTSSAAGEADVVATLDLQNSESLSPS